MKTILCVFSCFLICLFAVFMMGMESCNGTTTGGSDEDVDFPDKILPGKSYSFTVINSEVRDEIHCCSWEVIEIRPNRVVPVPPYTRTSFNYSAPAILPAVLNIRVSVRRTERYSATPEELIKFGIESARYELQDGVLIRVDKD